MTEGSTREEIVAEVDEEREDEREEAPEEASEVAEAEAESPDESEAADEAPEATPEEADDTPEVDDWSDQELQRAVAALVFASPDPLGEGRLAKLLGGVKVARVREALEALGGTLEGSGLPFVLKSIAGGWRMFTSPEVAEVVARLARSRKIERISPAALETLAIIAYRQPVTKAEIEAIRGVQAGAILRSLVDRGLVRVTGRADQPGSPLQYGTTREFLDRFELESLKDLPRDGELVRD